MPRAECDELDLAAALHSGRDGSHLPPALDEVAHADLGRIGAVSLPDVLPQVGHKGAVNRGVEKLTAEAPGRDHPVRR